MKKILKRIGIAVLAIIAVALITFGIFWYRNALKVSESFKNSGGIDEAVNFIEKIASVKPEV